MHSADTEILMFNVLNMCGHTWVWMNNWGTVTQREDLRLHNHNVKSALLHPSMVTNN